MPETLGRAVATNSATSWDRTSESRSNQQTTAAAETLLAFRHRIIMASVALDAVLAHHRAPELHLLGQEPSFLLGAGQQHGDLHVLRNLPIDGGLAQGLRQRGAEALDDRLGRAGGGEYAPPRI